MHFHYPSRSGVKRDTLTCTVFLFGCYKSTIDFVRKARRSIDKDFPLKNSGDKISIIQFVVSLLKTKRGTSFLHLQTTAINFPILYQQHTFQVKGIG